MIGQGQTWQSSASLLNRCVHIIVSPLTSFKVNFIKKNMHFSVHTIDSLSDRKKIIFYYISFSILKNIIAIDFSVFCR